MVHQVYSDLREQRRIDLVVHERSAQRDLAAAVARRRSDRRKVAGQHRRRRNVSPVVAEGRDRSFVPCSPAKKNSLFWMIGPPIVPPNWFRFSPSFVHGERIPGIERSVTQKLKQVP